MSLLTENRRHMEYFLKSYAGRNVLFLPNPGNAGDSVIAHGTYEALRRASINITCISPSTDVTGQTVFLSGGGNFIPIYHSIENALKNFLGKAKEIVLLPHTIRGNEVLLSKMDESCTIFCRDAPSYEHVTHHNNKSKVYLDHDMAFHIDTEVFLSDPINHNEYFSFMAQKLREQGIKDLASLESVEFYRSDLESARTIKTACIDVSVHFSLGEQGTLPEKAKKSAWAMLKAAQLSNFVSTDRLHVGICCALVNTPCIIYDNSYGKNASIYRHSLRNRTPFIHFKKFE